MNIPIIAVIHNWRNEKNLSGLYSIHLRISINSTSKYFRIEIPQKIKLEEWSGKECFWVMKTHPFHVEINNKIEEIKNRVQALIKKNYAVDKETDFQMIFRELNNKNDSHCFLKFAHRYICQPPDKLELNTIKKYKTALRHLVKFKSTLHFSEIDNAFLRAFVKYMQVELKLGGAAVKKYFIAIRKIVKQAHRENYISSAQMEFLFDGLKIKVSKSIRMFLDPSEIKRLKEVVLDDDRPELLRDRDLFLLQVYTGYYYKDLRILEKKHIYKDSTFGTVILGERSKNGQQTIIPLFKFPFAETIIQKYKSAEKDALLLDKNIFTTEQSYNLNLKEIARLAGIDKKISNKTARHTSAQLWVRYGATKPVLSKILGHTNESTTSRYYDVNLAEIFEGTRKVDFSMLEI